MYDWQHQLWDALVGGLVTALFGLIARRIHRIDDLEKRMAKLELKLAALTGEPNGQVDETVD